MAAIATLDTALMTRIVFSLGHFLWQGAIIAVLTFLLATALRRRSPQCRYLLHLTALLLMLLCPLVTFLMMETPRPMSPHLSLSRLDVAGDAQFPRQLRFQDAVTNSSTLQFLPSTAPRSRLLRSADVELSEALPNRLRAQSSAGYAERDDASAWQQVIPYLAGAYLLGVLMCLARLLIGLDGARRLRRFSWTPDKPALLDSLVRKAQQLRMRSVPLLLICERVSVPTVIGILRPIILLPLSISSGLSLEQVESIVAHELAHIRRYDHLVNLLQRLIESVLFFHPAVWWVSHRIRVERELCCDDLVIGLGTDRVTYASSLLEIAERSQSRQPTSMLSSAAALYAVQHGSQLGRRIRRIVDAGGHEPLRLTRASLAGWLLVVGLVALLWQVTRAPTVAETRVSLGESQVVRDESPRGVVDAWIKLTLTDDRQAARELTTQLRNIGAEQVLQAIPDADQVAAEHALGSDNVSAVITNIFHDADGNERRLLFWLTQRHDRWLIIKSDMDAPQNIHQQLQGFLANIHVRWQVTAAELIGHWHAGVGPAAGSSGVVCGSELLLHDENNFTLHTFDPAGERSTTQGTWRLDGDRIIRMQDEQELVCRITWITDGRLHLESLDGEWLSEYELSDAAGESAAHDDGQQPQNADGEQTANDPRAVAQHWMDLVRQDKIQQSFAFTTGAPGVSPGSDTVRGLQNTELRTVRSLGNEAVALVASNTVRDYAGRERMLVLRLVNRDGRWLIAGHDWQDPAMIDAQLRGFFAHGDSHWHVTPAELVGEWRLMWLVHNELDIAVDGTLTLRWQDEVAQGSWQLRGDQFRWDLPERNRSGQIVWLGESSLTVQWPDGTWESFLRREPRPYELAADELARALVDPTVLDSFRDESGTWGRAVYGMRSRFTSQKTKWPMNATPEFAAEIRNDGFLSLQIGQAQQICELEVDGTWYRWHGDYRVKLSSLAPGDHFSNIQVTLDQHWRADGRPLLLTEGTHRARIAFVTSADIRVESNLVEFEIVDQQKANDDDAVLDFLQPEADPLRKYLPLDDPQLAERARQTQRDEALVLRVGKQWGFSDAERRVLVELAKENKTGRLNFETQEKLETFRISMPRDYNAADFNDRFQQAFESLFGFTDEETQAFRAVMQRTNQKTLTLWQLADGGELSAVELAAAEKVRRLAAEYYLNREVAEFLPQQADLTREQAAVLKQLQQSVERTYQELCLIIFRC